MRVRPQRAATRPLESHMVDVTRERLDRHGHNNKDAQDGVRRLNVRLALGHPHAHGEGRQRSEPRKDLPGGVRPEGEAAREQAEEHAAYGEQEGEGEAAEDAVGLLDGGFEAFLGEELGLGGDGACAGGG